MFRSGCLFLLLFISSLLHGQDNGYQDAYRTAEKYYRLVNATALTDSLALASYRHSLALLEQEHIFNAIRVDACLKSGILQMSDNHDKEAVGRFQRAITSFDNARQLKDSLLFQPYLYAGSIHYNFNNLDSAVYYYKKAEAVTLRYPALNEAERLYNKMGALYYETGDYKRSIPYYEKAVSIVAGKKTVNAAFMVTYKNNIASSFLKMGSYAAALDIYMDLLRYHLNEDGLYTNISLAYLQAGNTGMALQFLRRIKQKGVIQFNNLTKIFLLTHQYDSAAYYNRQAATLLEEQKQTRSTDNGLALKYAGDIKCRAGNIREGLKDYQSSINVFVPAFTDTAVAHNPSRFPASQQFSFLFDALTAKAAAFKLLKQQEHRQQYLQQSLAADESALALARQVERLYSSDDARLFLKNKVNAACTEAVSTALALYNHSKDQQYISMAFGYVEHNKASVLQAAVQQQVLSGAAGLPAGLVAAEKNGRNLVTRLSIQLAQGRDSVSLTGIQKKMQEAELQLSAVQEKLDENPAYRRLKFNLKEISIEKIQQQLISTNEALLSYYYTNEQLLCFYITREDAGCTAVPVANQFFTAIKDLRRELQTPGNTNRLVIDQASQYLFQLLVKPVIEKIKHQKRLVIIPYNEICYLPFELLKDPASGSLLLKQFAVSYNYSAGFLAADEKTENIDYRVLAMAPFSEAQTGLAILPALPSSAGEVAGLKGIVITGTAATREKFMTLSGQFPVLHLATHATVNDTVPLGSYIEFYGEQKDADSLHRLYEKEIYNLDMKAARLVILSACETGNGLLVNGEGIVSLSRAFSYAGCKSVITSLWKADDVATAFIVKRLHVYLQKGLPKDEALQKAKLDYLSSTEIEDRYKLPAYWAHLVLMGDQQPVIKSGINWLLPVIVVVLLAVVMLLLYAKKKRAQ